jgi:hypothetical protein
MEHCGKHDEYIDRINKVEAAKDKCEVLFELTGEQISDLFTKYNAARDLDLKIIDQLGRMEEHQKTHLEKLGTIDNNFTSFKEEMAREMAELKGFDWFRKRANKLRDTLPGKLFWGLMAIILALCVLQDLSFARVFKLFKVGTP